MNILYEITKIKSIVKTKLSADNKIYKGTQYLYRKIIIPIEHSLLKQKTATGFESEKALYMCSLLPKKTLDTVMRHYQPGTWLDVGCGTGRSLKYIQKHGIKIFGIENSELAIKVSNLNSFITKHDLTVPLNLDKKFDVAWCYEVAEHLPETSADTLIDTLTLHGEIIVLSAATPGQGGEGHINEQPHSYWIKKMNNKGFVIDEEITNQIQLLDELYSRNVYCYKKNTK